MKERSEDVFFMERALDLAERGRGFVSPNPLVGAIVVKDGKVLGEGWHKAYGGPHAEVFALDQAGSEAEGASLYVSLEPCNHHGKTPPCTEAILKAGIRRVLIAMQDPNPKAAGGVERLKEAGLEVEVGLCRKRAEKVNAAFLGFLKKGLPYTVLKCSMTLDGYIATLSGDSKWVSSSASRDWCHSNLRQGLDAIMVGSGTIRSDNPSLTCRPAKGGGRDPLRVVLASNLDIPLDSKILSQKSKADTILLCARGVDKEKKEAFIKKGARVFELDKKEQGVDIRAAMEFLADYGVRSVLLEGGARLAASTLNSGLVDHLIFFYAPKILGGRGISVLNGPSPLLMSESIILEDMEVFQLDSDIRVEGRPVLPLKLF